MEIRVSDYYDTVSGKLVLKPEVKEWATEQVAKRQELVRKVVSSADDIYFARQRFEATSEFAIAEGILDRETLEQIVDLAKNDAMVGAPRDPTFLPVFGCVGITEAGTYQSAREFYEAQSAKLAAQYDANLTRQNREMKAADVLLAGEGCEAEYGVVFVSTALGVQKPDEELNRKEIILCLREISKKGMKTHAPLNDFLKAPLRTPSCNRYDPNDGEIIVTD